MNAPAIFLSLVITLLVFPLTADAVETAQPITDRELIEKLTRLDEGQNTLRAGITANAEAIRQLRADMNAQFDRAFHLILGILGAFASIVAVTIGFAIWDRRTMIRPFETKVKAIEEEIATDRHKLHALLDALRALSRTDEKVAGVLKQFNLL